MELKTPRIISQQRSELRRKIISTVYGYFELPISMMYTRSKKTAIVYPRQILFYLFNEYETSKPNEIASISGGFDRSTISYSIDTIKDRIAVDEQVAFDVEQIKLIIDAK